MPSNKAAYLTKSKSKPLVVREAPYTSPKPNQIVVKNAAVAINPLDWVKQDMGELLFSWIKYPFVMGSDVAGEVVEVGPGVIRFNIGDRVLGHCAGMDKAYNTSSQCAFQEYTVLLCHMASPIPDSLSYEDAVVLPLGASTAACGLFQQDQLALQLPSMNVKPIGKTLIVWGGATSVGCNAIQLAKLAGYEVFAVASSKNFDLLRSLGASQVFDYRSKTIVQDLKAAMTGKTTAGALSLARGATEACLDVLNSCKGNKFISMASFPLPETPPKHFVLPITAATYISWSVSHWITSKARGIRSKFIFGLTLVDNGVGKAIYEEFLPGALASGIYMAAPEPQVVGKGLERIQEAMEFQKKGVSARKVVVSL